MKITVIVRTHNEELNLQRFVEAYHDWVDHILIEDDESDSIDYLVEVVDNYPKTCLDFYDDKRINRGKVSRAYQHIQLNGLINWAESLETDWIIMDDCDCIPNKHLRKDARKIIETCPRDFLYATRLYFYKDQGYFPKLSKSGKGEFLHSLWAWRANKGFKFLDNKHRAQRFVIDDRENKIQKINIPYALLHYPWSSDDVIEQKRKYYTEMYGKEYGNFNPLNFGGKLEQTIPEYGEP